MTYAWGSQGRLGWECVQFFYFAKFQPSIVCNYELWRLVISSFMFKNGVQFYFNNFSLNMMGYVIERQSRLKFLLVFYGCILAGHMMSCVVTGPEVLTVGTSCGTIGLLPIEMHRYFKLRRTNPVQAGSRQRFLIFNILSNFVLNILAVFNIMTVDWSSHVGCLIAGMGFYFFFEAEDICKVIKTRPIIIRLVSLALLVCLYLALVWFMWFGPTKPETSMA